MMKSSEAIYSLNHMLLALLLVDCAVAFHVPASSTPTQVGQTFVALNMAVDEPSNASNDIRVAMTREDGKNGKLHKALEQDEEVAQLLINAFELPCIAHADGPDLGRLPGCLTEESWDYVAITSPEAARVLVRGIQQGSSSGDDNNKVLERMQAIPVAAVGKATEKELRDNNLNVAFTPSKAYAKNLVAELPGEAGTRLLYPASCRAPGTLADGLTERGFQVVRLNTYDTVTAEWTAEQRQKAQECQIACFASPSSVKGWLKNYNNDGDEAKRPTTVLAACIGKTSATACQELGWDPKDIFFPDSPGIEGWVDAIKRAAKSLNAVPV